MAPAPRLFEKLSRAQSLMGASGVVAALMVPGIVLAADIAPDREAISSDASADRGGIWISQTRDETMAQDRSGSLVLLAQSGLIRKTAFQQSPPAADIPVQVPVTPEQAGAPAPRAAAPAAAPPLARRLNPTNRIITIPVPLVDAASELGDVRLTIGLDDSLSVNTQDFLTAIGPVLDPRALQALEAVVSGSEKSSLGTLEAAGYRLTYNPDTLSLALSVAAENRTVRNVSLAELDRATVGTFAKPAGFSAYANFRTSLDYVSQGATTGLADPQVFVDAAARFRNVVLETEGSYQSNAANGNAFRRQGTRFVYDDRERTIRWTLGDLRPVTRGFQSSGGVAGISLFRSYSQLEPQKNIRPRGDRSFTLLRPSTVETFINDQSIKRLRLNPGTYKVSDFPFVQGSNDVRFVIQDDAGLSESIEFNLFFDRSLLQVGIAEFGAFAGIAAPFGDSQPEYSTDDYIVSGFYRRGINERLTAGANAQFNKSTQLLGTEFLISSPIGTIGLDVAASNNDKAGSGYAMNFSYSSLFEGNGGGASQSFSLNGEYRSESFASVGTETVSNPIAYQVGGTYSRGLGQFAFIVFDARMAKGRGINPDSNTLRVSYGQRLGSLFSLTVDATYTSRDGTDDTGIRISLTRRIGERSSVRADYETLSNRARIALQTSRGNGVGAISGSADLDISDGAYSFNGGANYTANRAELGINHSTAFATGGDITDQRTSLRIGTSLAFADGAWAVGRPISDSFAIIVPHKSVNGKRVEIEPRDGTYDAASGALGGAVATGLSSFSERTISFDVPDAPPGYDLGQGNLRVLPPYRSGYVAVAGSDYSKTVLGRLVDRQNQPLAFVSGKAVEVANPERPALTIFTNREGRFGASGLRPGKWRLEIAGEIALNYQIDVPDTANPILRLGDLSPLQD